MIKIENIYLAWKEFCLGKTDKESVLKFGCNLEDNLFLLKNELDNLTYHHSSYERFVVCDTKKRIIHKANVRDRVVHTLTARMLEKIYQSKFILQSYSCQKYRGTLRALADVTRACRRQSCNYTHNFWYLKCDIKKFFDNIDHGVLFKIIRRNIKDEKFLWLLKVVLNSFCCKAPGIGLPLGNFTSQWLGNIYLNELDVFVKQRLKVRFYFRYADDFVLLSDSNSVLETWFVEIKHFLEGWLKLSIHNDKIILQKFSHGIDWVGYRILPKVVILKPKIVRRILKKITIRQNRLIIGAVGYWEYYQTLNSYVGQLKHCCGHGLSNQIIYNNFIYDHNGKIY